MSLINDYTYQTMTDQQARDLARLAQRNRRVRLALSGRVSWWRRVMARRQQRISAAAKHPVQRGMATPQHRVAH
jgi:aminoglycoside phosphotransferase (APT) family kinase protein